MQSIDDRLQQIEQRTVFQFRLLELNIVSYGVIGAFALTDPGYWDALLIAPVISFMLFLLWIHHGIAIRQMNWPLEAPINLWSVIRTLTLIIVLGVNFLIAPIVAVLLHDLGNVDVPTALLRYAGLYVIPISAGVLLLAWVYVQYVARQPSNKRALGSQTPPDESN